MNFSKAAIFGSIASSSSKRPASASVVFKPLPVMHSTVSSSAPMRPCADQRLRARDRHAAGGLGENSFARREQFNPVDDSASEQSSAQPPLERITRVA